MAEYNAWYLILLMEYTNYNVGAASIIVLDQENRT